jgi:hypothetical protein
MVKKEGKEPCDLMARTNILHARSPSLYKLSYLDLFLNLRSLSTSFIKAIYFKGKIMVLTIVYKNVQ